MSDRRLVDQAIRELAENPEQYEAVREKGHCVVLAGPGSGKTKTLTTAMARALLEDVAEPRGIACITYNNECAIELETRMARLGVETNDRVFIGTVHGFALSQIISPYARCVLPELPNDFRIATREECRQSVEAAHAKVINDREDPHNRWRFAEVKRRQDVDRTQPTWHGQNPELATFIEAYEIDLRRRGLIDFDDMPLIAFRMIQAHPWIRQSLSARFPVLFVDEYQDLGHALHELVLMLCFDAGVRLFAVGDADQSIYAFTGANPKLLTGLSDRQGVRSIRLRFNYRCGTKIIDASMAALGEERGYKAPEGVEEGVVVFRSVDGNINAQAKYVIESLIPELTHRNVPLEQIAILYRTASEGNEIATLAIAAGLPIVRADNQALVRRNSRLSRLIEACAQWVSGGWKEGNPLFRRLSEEAIVLVLGAKASREERHAIQLELVRFLKTSIEANHTAHSWLKEFREQLIHPWRLRARTVTEDWNVIDEMITRTSSSVGGDMSLADFGGRNEGSSRLNLSTLHSAKGREFDVVILFAMNNDVIPSWRDQRRPEALREARRLFYVGVTRGRKGLCVVYQKGNHSPWVKELYDRVKTS
ncbi:ATP-dependent helicase [Methylobacter sp. YRD-M1]|uniref:ATP-dependent helicase n=1 Tax=Methylobacter sp. YRD-M1 TaxID=2911520 RepID=UPI00227D3FC6|nr:ATP-dependent helicase [Methylobacter sp. YRD-M1]WAK04456.1 ATP-dependent helicase [Methylobacter sp. YRD-M1]